jgi:dihydropteroate synthase
MSNPRGRFLWNLGSRQLELGRRTLIMGIVNVTPDSFSDGGKFLQFDHAVSRALQLLEEGADILDIGGESTRPGAGIATSGASGRKPPVGAEEELSRVIPVIESVKRERSTAVVSVDTYKAVVAKAAYEAGAEIVNDVSGLQWDPLMAEACADLDCGLVLMHMRGIPETWRTLPPLEDPLTLVKHELALIAEKAEDLGIGRERIVLDPGFGFGKTFEENYPLLEGLDQLAELGFPILTGTSRKSFVGRAIGMDVRASERLSGSLAAMVMSIMKGAHIVRVHDVKESVQAARVVDAILSCNADLR